MANNVVFDDGWEFCFDPVDAGLIDQWYRRKPAETRQVQLPHLFSAEPNPEGAHIGYYFKSFILDKKDSFRRFCLRLPAAQHHCMVWMNGEELGSHLGGHTPFEFDCSRSVKVGEENHLVIRVQHLDRSGKILDLTAQELPLGAPYLRAAYAGIDGGITMAKAQKAMIRSLNVLPDFEADRISIEMRFWNNRNFSAELGIDITNPAGETQTLIKTIKLERENASLSLNLQFDNSQVWTLADPSLYSLKVSVPGADPVIKRFGMRGVDIEKGIWRLNHAQVKVRGVSMPWSFPFVHGRPHMTIDWKKELSTLKDSGINCLRSGGSPLPGFLLDICDEIGLLVLQETTCFNQKSSKDGLDSIKVLVQSLIESQGHHPCIYAWVMGSENGSMVLENGNKLLRFASELDPTRPIFSNLNSVYVDAQGGGKIDQGKVWEPLLQQISPYESHKAHLTYPLPQRSFAMLQSYLTSRDAKSIADGVHGNKSFWERYNYLKDEGGGKVLFDGINAPSFDGLQEQLEVWKKFASLPEYKDAARLIPELQQGLKDRGLDAFWKTSEDFLKDASALARAGLQRHLEALLSNTQVHGWFFENYADFGSDCSGLVNWSRQPKPALDIIRKVHRGVHVFAEAEERTPYVGTSAAIKIHLLADSQLTDFAVALKVKGPNGRVWHQEQLTGKAKPGYNAAGRFKFPVGFEKGRFTFELILSKQNKEQSKTEEAFFVPPEAKLDACLNKVTTFGPFPDTVTCSTTPDAKIVVLYDLTSLKDSDIKETFEKVEKGATVILAALTEEDTRKLSAMKVLPFEVNAFRCAGGPLGNFHYTKPAPEFKELPAGGLVDQVWAEIAPLWSLEGFDKASEKANIVAGAVSFLPTGTKQRVRWGVDLATAKLGKGKIVFCQFDIFARLGKNAMADCLFANLVALA
jgi:beta-galactosidase